MEIPPKLKLLELYYDQLENPLTFDPKEPLADVDELMSLLKDQKAVPKSFVKKLECLKSFSKLFAERGGPDFLSKARQAVWDQVDGVVDEIVDQVLKEQREVEKAHNIKIRADSVEVKTPK